MAETAKAKLTLRDIGIAAEDDYIVTEGFLKREEAIENLIDLSEDRRGLGLALIEQMALVTRLFEAANALNDEEENLRLYIDTLLLLQNACLMVTVLAEALNNTTLRQRLTTSVQRYGSEMEVAKDYLRYARSRMPEIADPWVEPPATGQKSDPKPGDASLQSTTAKAGPADKNQAGPPWAGLMARDDSPDSPDMGLRGFDPDRETDLVALSAEILRTLEPRSSFSLWTAPISSFGVLLVTIAAVAFVVLGTEGSREYFGFNEDEKKEETPAAPDCTTWRLAPTDLALTDCVEEGD